MTQQSEPGGDAMAWSAQNDENAEPIAETAGRADHYYSFDESYGRSLSPEAAARYRDFLNASRVNWGPNGIHESTNAYDENAIPIRVPVRPQDIWSMSETPTERELTEMPQADLREHMEARAAMARESAEEFRHIYYHHPRLGGRMAARAAVLQEILGVQPAEGIREDAMTDELRIPMERLEPVDVEQINAIVENRRVHSAFGEVLQVLGLGSEPGDQDFAVTLRKAVRTVKDMNAKILDLYTKLEGASDSLRAIREQYDALNASVISAEPTEARLAHGHDTQWRILSADDEVLETSEWVESNRDDGVGKAALKERLADWQLQGYDTVLAEYHRCRWVNVTTKKERERG